jgi:hypothetical protein
LSTRPGSKLGPETEGGERSAFDAKNTSPVEVRTVATEVVEARYGSSPRRIKTLWPLIDTIPDTGPEEVGMEKVLIEQGGVGRI